MYLFRSSITNTKELLKTSRNEDKKLTELLTGHCCRFRKYLCNLKLSLDSICEGYDEEDEILLNIICQCEASTRVRIEIFGQEELNQIPRRWDLYLMSNIDGKSYNFALKINIEFAFFLEEIYLFFWVTLSLACSYISNL